MWFNFAFLWKFQEVAQVANLGGKWMGTGISLHLLFPFG